MQANHVGGGTRSLSFAGAGVPPAALILCPQMQDYIRSCAAKHSYNTDDREDLFLDIVVHLLEYPGLVRHPKQFIRITARNLAINRAKIGSRYWEVTESALTSADDENVESLLECKANANSKASNPLDTIVLRDTLLRMCENLTPSEQRVYRLLQDGYLQADLPKLLGVSKQAISRTIRSIREKFLAAEAS